MLVTKDNVKNFLSSNNLLLSKVFPAFFNLSEFLELSEYGVMFCPFHDDRNKPSAKFFKDSDGIERIYCYSERKQFTSYDYVKLILEENPLFKLLNEYDIDDIVEVTNELMNNDTLKIMRSRLKDISYQEMSILDFIDLISLGDMNYGRI